MNRKEAKKELTEDRELKCGLVMPISAMGDYSSKHWSQVKDIIEEAVNSIKEYNFIVDLVSENEESHVIQKTIVQNVYNDDIVICDVSGRNPNVMFELGMRFAFDKCLIIIKDDKTPYSFDTGSIEHIPYPSDLRYQDIKKFQKTLAEKIIKTYDSSIKSKHETPLSSMGKFIVAKLDQKEASKEDFILEEISRLNSLVKSLNNNISQIEIREKSQRIMNSRRPRERDFDHVASIFCDRKGISKETLLENDDIKNDFLDFLTRRGIPHDCDSVFAKISPL